MAKQDPITSAINELDRAYTDAGPERGQWKIILLCFGVPPTVAEICNTMLDVYRALVDNDPRKDDTKRAQMNAMCKIYLIARDVIRKGHINLEHAVIRSCEGSPSFNQ